MTADASLYRQFATRNRRRTLALLGVFCTAALLVSCFLLSVPNRFVAVAARFRRDDKATGPPPPLRFRADGSFQISIFEDLHFGENAWDQWGPQQDINSVRVLGAVLDAEKPDLVVLNGDLITGENAFKENATVYLDQIVGPLVDRGLTWASTYGNHDSEYNLSRTALLAREQHKWPGNARTVNMVTGPGTEKAGVTNFYLPVYGSDCDYAGGDSEAAAARCTPRLILWFFDSRGGFLYQQKNPQTGQDVGQEDWVDASVVDWFERTQAALHAKYAPPFPGNESSSSSSSESAPPFVLPSLAFVHIPPNVSLSLQNAGIDKHRQPGINDDVPLAQQAQGWCADGSNAPACVYGGQDEPFMRAIAAAGNGTGVVALFSGHDHGDTWCHTWDSQLPGMRVAGTGVHVCFGQHTGYGGYGTWTRGGRQVRVTEARLKRAARSKARADIDTWIRLETGAVVGNVTLNATYGRDAYPATPDTHTHCPTCHYGAPAAGAAAKEEPVPQRLTIQAIAQYFGW